MSYGLFTFDKDGNPSDIHLQSSLVVEGVLFLGNAPMGLIALDMLFPRRNFFKGIFLLPQSHSIGNWHTEHLSVSKLQNGTLQWIHSYYHKRHFGDRITTHCGAFAGRSLLYGYFN
ncbi:Uncharacterised protein [Neisseria cinerea]|nr:Uncharacterised protein [Neisseria cinerea]